MCSRVGQQLISHLAFLVVELVETKMFVYFSYDL